MRTHYIDIGDDEWGVLLCHDFDILDSDYMAAIMDTFGMSDDNIREALQVLLGTNTGMTVSRSDICMSAMFIGRATSREQYADTIAHEIDHVKCRMRLLRHTPRLGSRRVPARVSDATDSGSAGTMTVILLVPTRAQMVCIALRLRRMRQGATYIILLFRRRLVWRKWNK